MSAHRGFLQTLSKTDYGYWFPLNSIVAEQQIIICLVSVKKPIISMYFNSIHIFVSSKFLNLHMGAKSKFQRMRLICKP